MAAELILCVYALRIRITKAVQNNQFSK